MQRLNQAKLFKNMWKYLNKHFGFSYPYPDVFILIINEEETRIICDKKNFSSANLLEKDKQSDKPLRDGFLSVKKQQPEEVIKTIEAGGRKLHEFEIFLADAKIPHDNFPFGIQRENLIKTCGFMNYYYFVVFHEFIHILEWLCGNHNLYSYDQLDLELFNSFMGWDYEIGDLKNRKMMGLGPRNESLEVPFSLIWFLAKKSIPNIKALFIDGEKYFAVDSEGKITEFYDNTIHEALKSVPEKIRATKYRLIPRLGLSEIVKNKIKEGFAKVGGGGIFVSMSEESMDTDWGCREIGNEN